MHTPKSVHTWKNSRDYLRHLINIAFVSISIPLSLFAWLYLEYSAGNLGPLIVENHSVLVGIGLSLLIAALLFYAHTTVDAAIKRARDRKTLGEKLLALRQALVRRYVLYAVISLAVVLGFVLTTHEVMVVWFAVMIVIYSAQNPSLHGIARLLRLVGREKEMILRNEPLGSDAGNVDEAH